MNEPSKITEFVRILSFDISKKHAIYDTTTHYDIVNIWHPISDLVNEIYNNITL